MWLRAHAECQPQGCRAAAAMLSASLALRAQPGSEDCMRFDIAWPVVMQDRSGEPKRAVRASLLTL
jgi:hypothetical protein